MGPCAETALFRDTAVKAEDGGLPKDSSKGIDTCRRSQQMGCKGERTRVALLDLIPSRKAECMNASVQLILIPTPKPLDSHLQEKQRIMHLRWRSRTLDMEQGLQRKWAWIYRIWELRMSA